MIYVFRGGRLVEKSCQRKREAFSFPTPAVSRMQPFESLVSGREITTWRERDREMAACGAVDPRDLAPPSRGRAADKMKEAKHGR